MKSFFETALGRVILVGIVMVIWGVNAFQFSDILSQKETVAQDQSTSIDIGKLTNLTKKEFVYVSDNSNPFKTVQRKIIENPIIKEPSYQKPRIALLGIMDDTIMILTELNEVVVMKEKQEINGIFVKEITTDSVLFVHQKKEFVLKINTRSL